MAKAKKPVSRNTTAAAKAKSGAQEATSSTPKVARASTAKAADSKAADSKAAPKTTATPAAKPASATAAKASNPQAKTVVENKSTPVPAPEPEKPVGARAKPAPADTAAAKPAETPEPDAKTATRPAQADVTPKATAAPLPPTPEPAKPQHIFLPLVLGGIVACGLGFLASEFDVLNRRGNTDAVETAFAAQDSRIAALEKAGPVAAPSGDIEGVTAQLAAISKTLAGVQGRLTALEERPFASSDGSGTAATAAYASDLATLRASVEAQKTEMEKLLNNAMSVEEATADAARRATLQNALAQVTAAINEGAPFAGGIAVMSANGLADLPEALSGTAASGVVTLINLQTRFPNAARAALADARAVGAEDAAGGLGGFLRRQLGARSVAPRAGSDPDAVLSRAEAALRDGQLGAALDEVQALPAPAQAAMQDWLNDARARHAAQQAVQTLSQRLTAN
ncbi:MAG: hypothetical protein ACJAVM_003067 [Sulfitobacter sp.]